MLHNLKLKLFAMLLMSYSLVAFADCKDCFRPAYVNAERIYSETRQSVQINAMLEQEFSSRRENLEKMAQNLISLQQQIEQETSSKKRKKLQTEFEEKRFEYLQTQRRLEESYSLRRNQEFSSLQHKANQAIIEVQKQKGYNIIFDSAILVDKKYDITDEIIQLLDKGE